MTMLNILAFGGLGAGEWLIILLVVVILFGAKRVPELARALGQAKKEFQKASREVADELHKDEKPADTTPAPRDPPSPKP